MLGDAIKTVRHMNLSMATLILCCAITACSPLDRPPLDQAAVVATARKAVARHEKWADGARVGPNLSKVVVYQPTQSSDGTWTIAVHRAITEDDSGNTGFEPNTKRIVVINETGRVVRYAHTED